MDSVAFVKTPDVSDVPAELGLDASRMHCARSEYIRARPRKVIRNEDIRHLARPVQPPAPSQYMLRLTSQTRRAPGAHGGSCLLDPRVALRPAFEALELDPVPQRHSVAD
jgi:hypothetical protein